MVPARIPSGGAAIAALGSLLAMAYVGVPCAWASQPATHPAGPNIVLIMSDDQRWDMVDATQTAPLGVDAMPHLQRELLDSGVRFDNAFVTTPLCCPSRSSVLTGQYASHHGVHNNRPPDGSATRFPDQRTLATSLEAAGYRTALFGKYMNGYRSLWSTPATPYKPPGWTQWHAFVSGGFFNYWLAENHARVWHGAAAGDYSTDVLRNGAASFIAESVALGKPFFLYFTPYAPHLPATPAPRHAGLLAGLQPWRPPSFNEADVSDKPEWVRARRKLPARGQVRMARDRRNMLESLLSVDEAVAVLMQALRDNGVVDRTIVIYFSDNGFSLGEHRVKRKRCPYEECIRVPMVVRYPALAPVGRRESAIALNVDFAPTLTELAGVAPPLPPDGISLAGILSGKRTAVRTDFLIEGWNKKRTFAGVREDHWKYVEHENGDVELYDLVHDPYELNSLAAAPEEAERCARMARRLRELRPTWPEHQRPRPQGKRSS